MVPCSFSREVFDIGAFENLAGELYARLPDLAILVSLADRDRKTTHRDTDLVVLYNLSVSFQVSKRQE